MALLASKDLTRAKKLPPVGLDLVQEIMTGLTFCIYEPLRDIFSIVVKIFQVYFNDFFKK